MEIGSLWGHKAVPKECVQRSRCYQHMGRALRGALDEHLSSQTSLRGIGPGFCRNMWKELFLLFCKSVELSTHFVEKKKKFRVKNLLELKQYSLKQDQVVLTNSPPSKTLPRFSVVSSKVQGCATRRHRTPVFFLFVKSRTCSNTWRWTILNTSILALHSSTTFSEPQVFRLHRTNPTKYQKADY